MHTHIYTLGINNIWHKAVSGLAGSTLHKSAMKNKYDGKIERIR